MHRIPHRLGVGRHVLIDARAAAHERERADAHELMNRHQSRHDRPVLDGDVPGHLDRVGDDDIVSDVAVVGEVHVRHEETALPHGRLPGRRGSPVDGAVLPDHRRVAHFDPGVLAAVLQVLRVVAEHAAVPDPHAGADLDVALEHRVRGDLAALADRHPRSDDRVWPDRDVAPDVRGGIDQGGPVDHRSTTVAIMSASATTCPSTYPTPFILHVLPRNCSISSSNRIWSPGTTGRRNLTLSSDMK